MQSRVWGKTDSQPGTGLLGFPIINIFRRSKLLPLGSSKSLGVEIGTATPMVTRKVRMIEEVKEMLHHLSRMS